MGWISAITANMPMMTKPTTPILLRVNSFQLRPKARRARRSRINHNGSSTTGLAGTSGSGNFREVGPLVSRSVTGWSCLRSLVADAWIQIHVDELGDQVATKGEHRDHRQRPD